MRVACTRSVLVVLLIVVSGNIAAQTADPKETLREIAGQSALLAEYDTLYRVSEELAFWQSVALLGAENGWQLIYSEGSTANRWPYTLRLYNALDEVEIEAKRAALGIARSRVATPEQLQAGADLYEKHLQLRITATDLHALLLDGRVPEAAALYHDQTLPLRRQIANEAYSASSEIRKWIAQVTTKSLRSD